jgi:hypothetical protein
LKYAKRTDGNQSLIVADLRSRGFQVIVTNFGNDFPDLLVGAYGQWWLMEVKQPDGELDRGQLEFLVKAKGRVVVVTGPEEAYQSVADGRTIGQRAKTELDTWLLKNPSQKCLSVRKFRKIIGEG